MTTPKQLNMSAAAVIARQNKRRGAEMERRVMKALKGNRVPMSGAGSLKGDGFVYRSFGLFLVECKLSSHVHRKAGPAIVIAKKWLEKIVFEARAMRAKFGVLVFHFLNDAHDYVVVPVHDFERTFFPVRSCSTIDYSARTNLMGYRIYKNQLGDATNGEAILFYVEGNAYVIWSLRKFIEIIDEYPA